MEKIIIYTDGSSRGNPGPGGWGAIIIASKPIRLASLAQGNNEEFVVEIGGREEMTTNNRMEITAAIESIKLINKGTIESRKSGWRGEVEAEIFSDSEYLIKGITEWIKNWQKNRWRAKNKKEVLNRDLWEKLLEETNNVKIEWKKVLGHSGHELNERCDEIATSFADGKNIKLYDGKKEGYEFH